MYRCNGALNTKGIGMYIGKRNTTYVGMYSCKRALNSKKIGIYGSNRVSKG
jgi:hypothetical protein